MFKGRLIITDIKKNPLLTYGCEMQTACEGSLSGMRAIEMTFLRMAVGLKKMEVYNDCEVYEMMGVKEQA